MPSPKNPASPNAAPTTPNASSWNGKRSSSCRTASEKIFDGLITSVTKFGFFVELTDLFVEGLVPLNTLIDDRYTYHENTREIIGQHSRKIYRIGQQLKVIVDRIDPVEKKINFAVLEEEPAKPVETPQAQIVRTQVAPQALRYHSSLRSSHASRPFGLAQGGHGLHSCLPSELCLLVAGACGLGCRGLLVSLARCTGLASV